MSNSSNALYKVKDYYHTHFNQYRQQTFHIDPASFLTPLLDYLTQGDTILDIGCGSCRDLLWFKQRGFDAMGFEQSKGLAELARKNVGCTVVEGDFETRHKPVKPSIRESAKDSRRDHYQGCFRAVSCIVSGMIHVKLIAFSLHYNYEM